MKVDDFDYHLPAELIAQYPLAERSASRLLHLDNKSKPKLHDRSFRDLPQLLDRGDVLVMNDTRVAKARLLGTRDSGGKVEVLVERVIDGGRIAAQVRSSNVPRVGTYLEFERGIRAEVLARSGEFFELRFIDCSDVGELLDQIGRVPLPPYIARAAEAADHARYQTVYARESGAVAAPTAGLHFDEALLAELRARGIVLAWLTLHVGAGTFQPVRSASLSGHVMHTERYTIPQATVDAIGACRAAGRRVVAVGTTTLRALESASAEGALSAGAAETQLFITPGYRFRVVDRLITNFHLPRSTLIMLVSAFAGMEPIRCAYRHAIEHRYRFFSYGDAMLLEREQV